MALNKFKEAQDRVRSSPSAPQPALRLYGLFKRPRGVTGSGQVCST
jgi:hypothetical protein